MAHPCLSAIARILTGAALVTLGAAIGTAFPLGLTSTLAAIVVLRICWLEDNIGNDLVGQETLPANHANPARRRRDLMARLSSRPPVEPPRSPALLATAMRGQVQAWMALLLGALAVVGASRLGLHPIADIAVGALFLRLALLRADALAVTLAHLDADTPLPRAALVPVEVVLHFRTVLRLS